MKSLISLVVLVVVGVATVNYEKMFAEPHFAMVDESTVYVRHRERVYTARYSGGNRSFEVLVDHRPAGKCKPRVEFDAASKPVLFGCDPGERNGVYPKSYDRFEGLPQSIRDDFAEFRPMADAYYASR